MNSLRIRHKIIQTPMFPLSTLTIPSHLIWCAPWETEVSKYALISATHRARNHVNYFLKLELWFADKIIRINLLKEGAKRAILISAI